MPKILEIHPALDRFAIGEIGNRIVAADRKSRLIAPDGGSGNRNQQQATTSSFPHGLPPGPHAACSASVASQCGIAYSEACLRQGQTNSLATPAACRATIFRGSSLSEAETCRHFARRCGGFQPPDGRG